MIDAAASWGSSHEIVDHRGMMQRNHALKHKHLGFDKVSVAEALGA